MDRNNPAPNLLQEIDALEDKLEARLADFVDEEAANCPGIPKGVLRNLLLKGASPGSFFAAMRQLLTERSAADVRDRVA